MLNWFKPKTVHVKRELTLEEIDAITGHCVTRADAWLRGRVDTLEQDVKARDLANAGLRRLVTDQQVKIGVLEGIIAAHSAQDGRHTRPDMADSEPVNPAESLGWG